MSLALPSNDKWLQPPLFVPFYDTNTPLLHILISQAREFISRALKTSFCRLSDTLRAQALLYFPVLLIARVSWVVQSVFFVFGDLPGAKYWSTKGAELDRASTKDTLATTLEVCEMQTPSVVPPVSPGKKHTRY